MVRPSHSSPEWAETTGGYRVASRMLRAPARGLARLRVRGLENVPASGSALVASNHLSVFDPVLISSTIPRPTYWLAKEALFRNKATAMSMRAFGCIKVDRESGGN